MRLGALCKGLLITSVSFSSIASADSGIQNFQNGYRFWQGGDTPRAYAFFEQIHKPTPPIDDLRLYATASAGSDMGRTQHAATLFQKLISVYPNSPWKPAAERKLATLTQSNREKETVSESARIQMAARYLKGGLPADAVNVLRPLVHISEKGVRGATDVLDMMATATFKARDYSTAAPVLKELLKRNGDNDLQLMTMLASAYARSDQFDAAIAMQRRLMKIPSETRKALYKIVFLEFDRENNRATINVANEYLGKYSSGRDRSDIVWMQAWSYFRLKEWTRAIDLLESYRDMVGSRDDKRRASYWIARCLGNMGNRVGAATAFGMIAQQDSGGYYGHLASARLRNQSLTWKLDPSKNVTRPVFGEPETAAHVVSAMGFYELLPVLGGVGSYRSYVERVAPVWGLTSALVMSLMYVESHFRPEVTSSAGAVGLMQIILPTALQLARELHLDDVFQSSDLKNPIWNVMLGMSYLRKLSGLFSHQLVPTIASYNAGEDAVGRWMKLHSLEDPEIFIEEIPYDETRAYVKKVILGMWQN